MIKIMGYLTKKDWGYIFLSIFLIVMQVWLDLKLPDYMSDITMLVQTEGSEMQDVLIAGGYMLACALGSLVLTFAVGYFVARIATGLAKRLRETIYDKTMDLSMEDIGKFSIASLITRSTNDITQIQTFVAMGLQASVKAPILAAWAVVKIVEKSWQWTAVTSIALLILGIILSIIIFLALPQFNVIQKLTDNLNRVTRENLTGIRVVRAYNAEEYQQEKFDEANEDLTRVNLFTNRLMAILQPGMQLINSGLTLGIYWVGVYLIAGAAFPDRMVLFSDMVFFSSYAMQVIMAFMMLSMTFMILPRATVSAKRINEVLDVESSIHDGTVTESELFQKGELEFKNVSFKYPGAADYVLENISFRVSKGETIAFIGSTGSGKSTLINLVPRFYDVTEGEILIDGVDIRSYKQETLRNKIGYVPQRAVMFSGTVSSNVSFGDNGKRKPDDEMVEEAIEIAQGKDFVEAMTDGYQARIAQGGSNVSGGQKQRLAIARAIARHPEFFLFDDSFSALDYRTDHTLRSTLKKQMKGITSLIVAQRVGTIMDADRIVVLDEGKVVGIGRHEELLRTCQVYREIAESQLSPEEIARALA